MKIIFSWFVFFKLLILSYSLNGQELKVFDLKLYEKNSQEKTGFISLSELYPLSENPDSSAIPDLEGVGIDSVKYIKLDSIYRERFLQGTQYSENDKIFIYDYSTSKLVTLKVKNLNVVACLNNYRSDDDWPYSQDDYLIGFEIDRKYLNEFDEYFTHALVYVGKQNHFVKGQLNKIVWGKIESKAFPVRDFSAKDSAELDLYFKEYGHGIGDSYKYETDDLAYFVQELVAVNKNLIYAKRVLINNRKTKTTIFEKVYFFGESASFAELENQWTGNLFRKKPAVIFGFQYYSFGCPLISFLDQSEPEFYIYCDNRH